MILLIVLPIRYSIERIKPFEKRDRNPQWVADLKELNKENMDKAILFNYEYPIEAMFYTNLIVYPYIPDRIIISDLIAKGYTVIINDNGNIPADVETINGIIKRKLTADDPY